MSIRIIWTAYNISIPDNIEIFVKKFFSFFIPMELIGHFSERSNVPASCSLAVQNLVLERSALCSLWLSSTKSQSCQVSVKWLIKIKHSFVLYLFRFIKIKKTKEKSSLSEFIKMIQLWPWRFVTPNNIYSFLIHVLFMLFVMLLIEIIKNIQKNVEMSQMWKTSFFW